jgi:hypothetical protein
MEMAVYLCESSPDVQKQSSLSKLDQILSEILPGRGAKS